MLVDFVDFVNFDF